MLKILNPYFKTNVRLDATDLSQKVDDVLSLNVLSIGKIATLAQIRGFLLPADAAKLSREVFNQICQDRGYTVINMEDDAA